MSRQLFNVTISSSPIVKKNTQRTVMAGGRIVRINSPRFRQWEAQAIIDLRSQIRPAQPISDPVILQCHFYMPTRRLVDLSNLYEGVQDVLVKCGILADDNSRVVIGHDGSRVFVDRDNPRTEIVIKSA